MQAIRNSYKVILAKYQNVNKGNCRLTQSSLLLIRDINASANSYTFPILTTDGVNTIQPEEIRLNQNDEFISYDISFYLLADVTQGESPNDLWSKYYLPYAPIELDRSFAELSRIWDSYLEIDVNKISRLAKWDMKKHNFIPFTQFKSVSTGLPYATQPNLNYSDDGTFPMQPMLTLSGAKKNDIILTLQNGAIPTGKFGNFTVPDHTAEAGSSNLTITVNRLALFFRGMLAQNASSFQS